MSADESMNRPSGEAEQSFGALLESYRSFLQRLAHAKNKKQLKVRISDSDLVQETFLSVLQNSDQLQGMSPDEVRHLLISVFLSRLVDAIRRHLIAKRRRVGSEVAEAVDLPETQAKTPSQIVIDDENQEALRRIFPTLDPVDQQILLLRYWEGHSFEKIAQRLNIPVSTVWYRWSQSLHRLSGQFHGPE
jgi:RNA polymerase sigma-70 factor (ECF subfamily)